MNKNSTIIYVIINKAEATSFYVIRAIVRILSGRSFGNIMIIILRFRVGASKNKILIKETCAIILVQVIYETGQISLLRVKYTKFLFFMYFIVT